MISVIVPVYNVEPYIRECVDSLISQTYKDLELIFIDDGSSDGSGDILDEYASRDRRIRVFHTEHRGTSAARNLGIDKASSEIIGFTDADDHADPRMYGRLMELMTLYGADICSCGYIREPSHKIVSSSGIRELTRREALAGLFEDSLPPFMWNKIYRRELFDQVRFPEGHNFEDVITLFEILLRTDKAVSCPDPLYHYRKREGSIVSIHSMSNLKDLWDAHIDRFNRLIREPVFLNDLKLREDALKKTVFSITVKWRYLYRMPEDERDYDVLRKASDFIREHSSFSGRKGWNLRLRVGAFLCRHVNKVSFFTSFHLCRLYDLAARPR